MIIDFNKIEQNKLEKFKNGEGFILMKKVVDDKNTIARITIPQASSIGFHLHETDQEILFVIDGEGVCIENNNEYPIYQGCSNYCPNMKEHSIKNTGNKNLEIFAVITKK